MKTQLLACKLIEFPELNTEIRSFSKESANNLAAAIEVEGLLQPILVRPHADRPGHYLGISGRHRLYATKNVLKKQEILATIFDDVDERDAEQMTISENLWRLPLNRAQKLRATKRWWEFYAEKYPDLVAHRGAAGGAATKRMFEEQKVVSSAELADATEGVGQIDGRLDVRTDACGSDAAPIGFVSQLSALTGQSLRSAKRSTRLARTFSDDDLMAFYQMDVTQQDMERIARIKDEDRRVQIINLIVNGQTAGEAIAATMNDPTEVMGEMFKGVTRKSAKIRQPDDHLSDAEWFELHCRDLASQLADSTAYRASAIFYRRIIPHVLEFREAIRPLLVEAVESGGDPLSDLLKRACWFKHPKDWSVCWDCRGAGKASSPAGEDAVALRAVPRLRLPSDV